MSALALLVAVASGILTGVPFFRIPVLTGKVSFLRSLSEQALDRIRDG
jgi:hypothetical protein